jgi:dihydroneopterin aldolase/2-amino-4-hydroxy-6-hydroxymethyldihydropteridine diphosphokinase
VEEIMTDQIHIKDLLLRTIIGINDEERRNLQDVLINITLYADMRAAGVSDDIEDAVNYRTITKRIIKLVEDSRFYLVEKLAAEIAAICLEDPRVARATVRVEKPGALRFARSVGVEIDRRRTDLLTVNRAFISLGSNIDPEHNLQGAVQRLANRTRLLAVSRVYQTKPVGKTDQPDFLNAAVLVETELTARELKSQVLGAIEAELGRVRTEDKNAPRTIDLDISLFNDEILEVEGRHIPDPEVSQYLHIARPLADLASSYRHPEKGQTLLEIAQELDDSALQQRPDLVLWPL